MDTSGLTIMLMTSLGIALPLPLLAMTDVIAVGVARLRDGLLRRRGWTVWNWQIFAK
jgi:hypothetical protein